MVKRDPISTLHGGSQIGDDLDASSVMRRVTSPITLLQRLLRQQAQETAQGPPRGQILELPAPEGSQGSPQRHLNF